MAIAVEIKANQDSRDLLLSSDRCDKYDYLISAGCGVIGGLIDILFVGAPGGSAIGKWTDAQADRAVMAFARKMGWNPKPGNETNVKSAIGFLEFNKQRKTDFKGFGVNYDQRTTKDTNGLVELWTKNHHMKSLAHSPDVVGLFFSVLNQFSSTASFVDNGRLVTIRTETFELQGGNLIAKLFCGVANWFGHLMSDVTGSSGAAGRGTGIVMPFYELLGLCKFGKFRVSDDLQDFAMIATRAFQEGYDFRHGVAMAIPVVITDLSIRLIWAVRRHFQLGFPVKECIPSRKHDTLRVMLLVGNGTLCLFDAVDASVRSGGNALGFFVHLNILAWVRFTTLVIKEVMIRIGISDPLQKTIDAYARVNAAMQEYLAQLERIDVKRYEYETEQYRLMKSDLETAHNSESLNMALRKNLDRLGIALPYEGDFDSFMADEDSHLVFT